MARPRLRCSRGSRGNDERVLLCGEGKSELGSRAGYPVYQSDEQPGVLEELLKHACAAGWEIAGARSAAGWFRHAGF